MKWTKCIALVGITLMLSGTASAQLLKRLKEKAEKAVEKSIEGKKKTETEQAETDSNKPTSKLTGVDENKPVVIPSNCQSVFSLAPDEKVLYDESTVFVTNTGVSYRFVIRGKEGYFLIENGVRTGPFKEGPLKSNASSNDDDNDDKSNIEQKDPLVLKYSKTIGGKLHIVFNGKNYGPYSHISKIALSPDKKRFFAVVIKGGSNEMLSQAGMGNVYLVSSEGLEKAANNGAGMPMKFYLSENFLHCMVGVMDSQNQKITYLSSTGNKAEGSIMDLGTNKNMIRLNDKGDIVAVPSQSPTQLFVNGKEAASFDVPIQNMNRLFITADISKSVYYEGGKLYKGGGGEVSLSKGIVFPKIVTVGNNTLVYYFKIYKNTSGVKEVYLCKDPI